MSYSHAMLAGIVDRSATLAERLRGGGEAPLAASDLARQRFAKWRDTVSPDDDVAFDRRFIWDGLHRGAALHRLGCAAVERDVPLPGWASVFEELSDAAAGVFAEIAENPAGSIDRALRTEEPLAFEDVLLPFVRVARARLSRRLKLDTTSVDPGALADLEHGLLAELSRVCGETLFIEFSVQRASAPVRIEATGGVYHAFRERMLATGMSALFVRYPVLARLVGTRVGYWIECSSELLLRLTADAAALEDTFGNGQPLGVATAIGGGVGDSHRGGRAVRIVTFASGVRAVYKPRPIVTEVALGRLASRLNEEFTLPLRTPRCISRDGYGWVEFMVAEPCADAAAAQRYHQRVGMLLALAYGLGASDLHHENLIAAGEHPVLIDLEVLAASPASLTNPDNPTADAFGRAMWETVLRTALLPMRDRKRRLRDFGGLVRPVGALANRLSWTGLNTDWMSRRERAAPIPETAPNVPYLNGAQVYPDRYVDHILAGFGEVYDVLAARRNELLEPGAPIDSLRLARARVVLRDTSLYGTLIRRASHPTLLENGVDRSIALDVVHRAGMRHSERPPLWPTFAVESESLFDLDVPYFSSLANDTVLRTDDGEPIAEYTHQSGFDRLTERLANLGERDRQRQSALIRVAFSSHGMRREQRLAHDIDPACVAPDAVPLTREMALAEARGIGAELRNAALEGDGGWWWSGITHDMRTKQMWIDNTGLSLGHGRAGIALFFAGLYRVGGDTADASAARRALGRLADGDPRAAMSEFERDDALGMGIGLAGVVYALATIGRWLHDERLMAAAKRAARTVDDATLRTDSLLDVYGGSAGLLLSLLALESAAPSNELRSLAIACGHHILESRQTDATTGQRVWRTIEDDVTTGFAHGSSGIAYALMRLHSRTKRREFLDAAIEALAFEERLYLPSRQNWLEGPEQLSEPEDKATLWCTWCHGATGIGLSRIGALQAGAGELVPNLTARLTTDLGVAVQTTSGRDLGASDHLCCGNFGRISLLADAGHLTGDASALAAAHELAGRVVARAREAGMYAMSTDATFTPGLLQGTCGVGYELLRLAQPRRLSPVLLLA